MIKIHRVIAGIRYSTMRELLFRLLRLRKRDHRRSSPYEFVAHCNRSFTSHRIQGPSNADIEALATDRLLQKPPREIRVACIMDDFTFGSYQPECDLYQLTPGGWKNELKTFQPDLLFIESAWRGKDELWGSKVGHCSQELQNILDWCRIRHIPTVFWNKEDPVHFEMFLTTAKLFDFVFTTDMDCIHRYKASLGHERVYFLPFACQPSLHNPVEQFLRKDAFCFAGAYYQRYPERTRDLESFVQELSRHRPFEIYDRNFRKSDSKYKFPEAYQPYIIGTLPASEIGRAYKGYRYAINLNSVKQSQTMFARRVYELLGSNTLTISNYSRGVRLMFGELVISSDSGSEITRRLQQLDSGNRIDRLRLAGLRKVMSEHTYSDRFSYVLQKVAGREPLPELPAFVVLTAVKNLDEVRLIAAHVKRQRRISLSLTLLVNDALIIEDAEALLVSLGHACRVVQPASLQGKTLLELAGGGEKAWVTSMLPEDYYGPHYLLDLALATRYSKVAVVGKAARYVCNQNDQTIQVRLVDRESAYTVGRRLPVRSAAVAPEVAKTIDSASWLAELSCGHYEEAEQLAIDPYSYCLNAPQETWNMVAAEVDDLIADEGISLESLYRLAEHIEPMASGDEDIPYLNGNQLAQLLSGKGLRYDEGSRLLLADGCIRLTRSADLQTRIMGGAMEIASRLADGRHEYLYAAEDILASEFSVLGAGLNVPVHLEIDPGLNLSLVVLFLDESKDRLGHQIITPNRNVQLTIHEQARYVRFGLRVYAGGITHIKRLVLGHQVLEPSDVLGRADVLLLTNHYPSYDELYRNGFVHSRVKAYAERGVALDVFRLRKDEPISWHEFQNVDVTTGSQQALRRMLKSGRYKHVLVHFLDAEMWGVLKDFVDTVKITVWVHGAEVQPWWRREYNYSDAAALANAKIESGIRLAFWKSIFSSVSQNMKFVFVSRYFADEVMEDVGVTLQRSQYEIIHNPIDTDIFTYEVKGEEQRTKILSIRPYASRKYANDLSVKAVMELSKEPFFDELQFKFIGDGALFDETLKPIRDFENVSIERRFLSQQEIAAIHKEYGVFLCPTRMDAQGVSKDEAMSSGLVVVTNGVTAIPEFVDDTCGFLAPADDHLAMAQAIAQLYRDPMLFREKSENAAKRVRRQTHKELIVNQETDLIKAQCFGHD